MTPRRVHLRIKGLVQGVSYRASAQDAARRLGVRGWVRNLPGGDVEAMAEGSPDLVDAFIAWCGRGPSEARVDSVSVTDAALDSPLTGFEVRR